MTRRPAPAWRRQLTPRGWSAIAALVTAGLLAALHLSIEGFVTL